MHTHTHTLTCSHQFKVDTFNGTQLTFVATDKENMLRWIEAINSSKSFDPSPMLLHTTEGAVVHTGYMECQEFAHEPNSMGISPFRPMMSRKLGAGADLTGTFAAVDYGIHWTVLRSSGLVQCLVDGKPETIFNIAECRKIKVYNPKEMKEGSEYFLEVDTSDSRFVLKAELPTDHFDWVLAIEQILKQLHREKLLQGHRNRESSYIALKRLLLSEGQRGDGSQLYCLPRAFDDMEDIYDPPKKLIPTPTKEHKCSELLKPLTREGVGEPAKGNVIPLPPKDYLPPPLPPRDEAPPPLPPKGKTLSLSRKSPPHHLPVDVRPLSTASTASDQSDPDDDYVMMQSTHRALSTGSQTPTSPYGSLVRLSVPSQPITIPNHRTSTSKRSALLRQDSDSSSAINSPPPSAGSSLHDLHEGIELPSPIHPHYYPGGYSSTRSLPRQNSESSLGSSYGRQQGLTSPLSIRDSCRGHSSGYNSPLLEMSPSPGLRRSQSHCYRMNGISKRLPMTGSGSQTSAGTTGQASEPSKSDGMMVSEVQNHVYQQRGPVTNGRHHPVGIAHTWSMESDGYGSSNSSTEDLAQVLHCTCTLLHSVL